LEVIHLDVTKVCQKIIDDITLLIDSKIKNIARDRTFKAKIIEKVTDSKYKILYKNRYYTARCHADLSPDDMVYVCAPENNWSELFINLTCSRTEFNQKLTYYTSGDMSSLKDFVEMTAIGNDYMGMARIKDTGGWTPGGNNTWQRIIYTYQNTYNNGLYSVEGMYLLNYGSSLYAGFVSGRNGDYSISWSKLLG